ncbi:hypothetical protein GRF59_15195 [Paenibacillus sp. HJL G12]|uniref:Uncharacterized protein n=1 Tax=Paenibacillus dendrobii TaxID=2691084 RepID=A0A7X3IJ77_9BACL|nr:hypothetical protein [Paenibacillus dendrobii]MWV44967.1 hypothetical protein [Paenibacillus dendrobii]
MGTQFEDIYDVFLSQISDSIFLEKDSDDNLKYRYLLNSIPRFKKCRQDLSKRDSESFDEALNDEDILILGTLMVVEYLNPLIISIENLKQFMSSKDFSMTSQAAHLKQLSDIREIKRKEADKLILDYTYNNGNLGNLK